VKASPACREFIEAWEGRRNNAYVCSAGRWTIGVGHMMTLEELSRYHHPLTNAEVEELFTFDLYRFEEGVSALVRGAVGGTEQHHFDALVAFAFNVGLDVDSDDVPEGLGDSTLLKRHLLGHRAAAADEFLKWNKVRNSVTGKLEKSAGLSKRRFAERQIYAYSRYDLKP
jgi:lysozyme